VKFLKKYKICVYAITKNEENFVDRWMDAVKEADLVVVLDTGSNDKTVEKLRNAGAIVYEEKIDPWRFDTARNIAMDYIPEDVDICVSNDLDEIFVPGWREKLESAWTKDCTKARYLFSWTGSEEKIQKQYAMEKIHGRNNFRWVRPVHEVLEYKGEQEEKTVWVDGLILYHKPDMSKSRSQYLPLLELAAKEDPKDDRIMFWLGREYMYNDKHDLSIKTFNTHLSLPTANWSEERSASMRYIGINYEKKRDKVKAKQWFFRALAECPHVREPYLQLVKTGYKESNWELTYAMVEKGLSITKSTDSYLTEPESWGEALYDYGAISAYNLGLYSEAYDYAQKAVEMNNTNERLKNNLRIVESKILGI